MIKRNIEEAFNETKRKHPMLGAYIVLAEIVAGKKYSRRTLNYWLNKLVPKQDYESGEKGDLLDHLFLLSNGSAKVADLRNTPRLEHEFGGKTALPSTFGAGVVESTGARIRAVKKAVSGESRYE